MYYKEENKDGEMNEKEENDYDYDEDEDDTDGSLRIIALQLYYDNKPCCLPFKQILEIVKECHRDSLNQ